MDTESGRSVDLVFYSTQGQQGHQLKMKGLRRKEWNVIVIAGGVGGGGRRANVLEKLNRVARQCNCPSQVSVIHLK